jgi:hypothetical protein
MGSRRVEVTILSEDRQQQVFAGRLLKAIGFHTGSFRFIRSPDGEGAAEQFVREHYPQELDSHKRRGHKRALKLVVLTDADILTVEGRRKKLAAEVESLGYEARKDDEAVALLIPRRNIETWLHYLTGEPVDELTDYKNLYRKKHPRPGDCQPAVDNFEKYYRSGWQLPDDCPDSLRQAVEELKRIL